MTKEEYEKKVEELKKLFDYVYKIDYTLFDELRKLSLPRDLRKNSFLADFYEIFYDESNIEKILEILHKFERSDISSTSFRFDLDLMYNGIDARITLQDEEFIETVLEIEKNLKKGVSLETLNEIKKLSEPPLLTSLLIHTKLDRIYINSNSNAKKVLDVIRAKKDDDKMRIPIFLRSFDSDTKAKILNFALSRNIGLEELKGMYTVEDEKVVDEAPDATVPEAPVVKDTAVEPKAVDTPTGSDATVPEAPVVKDASVEPKAVDAPTGSDATEDTETPVATEAETPISIDAIKLSITRAELEALKASGKRDISLKFGSSIVTMKIDDLLASYPEDTRTDTPPVVSLPKSAAEFNTLLENRIKSIQSRLSTLEAKTKKSDRDEIRIRGYKIELDKLNAKLAKGREDSDSIGILGEGGISFLDGIRDGNEKTRNSYQERIQELKRMRDGLTGGLAKGVASSRIRYLEKKLERIQKRDGFWGGLQRTLMWPKHLYEMRKMCLLSAAQGEAEFYRDKKKENDELKEMLKGDEFKWQIFDRLKANIRGSHYMHSGERACAKLERMQKHSSIILMDGARVTSLVMKPTKAAPVHMI